MTAQDASRPRIAITGPEGFVAWHTRCAAHARWGGDLVPLGRAEFASPESMAAGLRGVDAIVHLAGVNRAPNDETLVHDNLGLADRLIEGLVLADRPIPIVYGNSIHSRGVSTFGRAKGQVAERLDQWARHSGATVCNVIMPNLFGEHGVPFYNSVVATFCRQLCDGTEPTLVDDKPLPLLHVQQMADILLDLAVNPVGGDHAVPATTVLVSEVLARLRTFVDPYRSGQLPDLADDMTRDLFNTYRSATFPDQFPIYPYRRVDERGTLVEAVQTRGGEAQVFFSTTVPGQTRGQHYHRRKIERFVVVRGSAVIQLRRLFTHEVIRFPVTGGLPAIVDMPTLWVHSITNTGDDELITLFFADELYDPARPDTIPEDV